ncbi:polysaccharide pyruvyl transferase family protein [Compostimonas suwonensis]|uniref:Polysaccharide pyruvyl transferase WcaK-like protein n=1 Tax=Compostimonas suwonensis TaxID=1048394 RepID=A0A2M9BC80_9MICO|nr:polysaccharide pyruvyl transferase family protein [Compostimonas suwonensis]PJJ55558.1 polysaccharide pyruvyl transferase WcaK-like protein [Compostimonas suwonensis]
MSDKPTNVFIVLTGVSGNLGDAVIRRRVLEWVRGTGTIHAYLGRTTPGWVEQIGLRDGEIPYNAGQRKLWLRKLLFGPGPRALVFDPGEVPLGKEHLKSEAVFLLMALIVRIRGGVIVRPPRAVGDYHALTAWFYRLSCRLSQVVLWRDAASLAKMRVGKLVPDTAFGEPRVPGRPASERRTILVSMRGKRAFPDEAWFAGIAEFAASGDYEIVAMSQVDEDEERSRELAESFGEGVARYLPWGSRGDAEQELAIRALYEECALVVSDRLHVLILSAQAGAVPVEIARKPKPKVADHFATVGLTEVSLDAEQATAETVVEFLRFQETRHDEVSLRLADAHTRLDSEVQRLATLIVKA